MLKTQWGAAGESQKPCARASWMMRIAGSAQNAGWSGDRPASTVFASGERGLWLRYFRIASAICDANSSRIVSRVVSMAGRR